MALPLPCGDCLSKPEVFSWNTGGLEQAAEKPKEVDLEEKHNELVADAKITWSLQSSFLSSYPFTRDATRYVDKPVDLSRIELLKTAGRKRAHDYQMDRLRRRQKCLLTTSHIVFDTESLLAERQGGACGSW
jgi:hypothetical protein